MKKILIMAGGTGGHVFPGLAIAKELSKNNEFEVLWLGTKERMEAQLVPKHGFNIEFIKIEGLRRNGLANKLRAPFKILKAILSARKIIKKFKPDVVLGMGGYASGPGGIAAKMLGIPLVLHEQNAVPGFTNKILSKIATKVLLGFDGAIKRSNAVYVGNPVRAEVLQLHNANGKQFNEHELKLLVVGGSLGAEVLNKVVPQALNILQKSDLSAKVSIVHQTGKGQSEKVLELYNSLNLKNFEIKEFIDDMALVYKNSDLIICRAGALTVAEVATAGIPAIFVPLPTAVDDHQTKNAMALANNNAALHIAQRDLTPEVLAETIKTIATDINKLSAISKNASNLAKLKATEEVAQICRDLAQGK